MDYRLIGDDGREYGPVSLEELSQWAHQGRISRMTLILRSDTGRWAHAAAYAELDGLLVDQTVKAEPAPAAQADDSAFSSTSSTDSVREPDRNAYPAFSERGRGSTILAMGLVSILSATLFSCLCLGMVLGPVFGIIAWTMGAVDLRKINAGLINPVERSFTKAGMVCGILGTFLGPVIGIISIVASILAFLSGAFHSIVQY